uniref:SLIT-ROBO Rho GTPase-activating protein 1-like n=1 Tax=Callorhinchus milii TaxID=7868 RepID=A0A4W3H104_CALMI
MSPSCLPTGEDPLDSLNEHSVDSVAGVLKLYFRGLSRPIFPKEKFADFMTCVQTENLLERAYQIKKVIGTLPSAIRVVMRYLFAFLNQ